MPQAWRTGIQDTVAQKGVPVRCIVLGRMIPHEPIAIIAAACRFPGADTPAELWRLAQGGQTCFGPPPKDRWPSATTFVGAFLDDVETFDAGRFGIAARDAAAIDPQQRLILTLVDETRSLGPPLETSEVGVFMGAGHPANVEAVARVVEHPCSKELLAGNLLSLIAARVAYAFDLHGPVATIDSACASSLVALHQACQALRADECDAAYVGGVHLNLTPLVHRLFEHAGALSPSGRLLPFSEDGDGTLPADGAGVMVIEPLSRARRLGHRVWATILGSAVNNCGRTMGVMAPKPARQITVMRRALANARVSSADIRFVEAHATGTRLGDAIERRSIAAVYPHGPQVGAIKGQIGHALTAAGMASLIRAIGELGSGDLGAVNAFGFGGTNAHVVLRGEDAPRETAAAVIGEAEAEHQGAPTREQPTDDDLEPWVSVVERGPDQEPRFRPAPAGADPLRPGGRYLLTGGSGGLGREVARFLARAYHARLVLTGRRSLDREIESFLETLDADGGSAVYVPADLTCDADVARLIAAARTHVGEVDGLFHLAGVTGGDALVVKRDGLLALRALDPPLTVLFSSIAALFTPLGVGLEAYAAANAWLDTYAIAETQAGRRVVSIAWAPWTDVGMAAAQAEFYRRRGVEPVAPALAVRAMRRAIASGAPHVAIFWREPVDDDVQEKPAAEDLRREVHALIAQFGNIPASEIRGDAHLMALGIDSLSAVDLVCALEQRLGQAIPTTFLFEYDTVDALIDGLARLAPRRLEPAPRVDGASERGPLRLLDTQQTFLVQQRFFPELPCNVFLACNVHTPEGAPLDRATLAAALAAVVRRHPVLRSVVGRDRGVWVQRLGDNAPALVWVERVDDEAVANTVLDLERGPLMHLVSDGHRVALQAHHLLLDAWSAKLILEALLAAYIAPDGAEVSPPPPGGDWWTASPLLRRASTQGTDLEFWRERLERLPPLPLPWDGDVSAAPRGPACAHRLSLSAQVTQGLDALARQEAVTLPALVLAGYAQLLFDISGQHDLLVRVAMARRDVRMDGVGKVVGAFADSLPVRITLRPGEGPGALARRVQAELLATRQHSDGASSVTLAELGDRAGAGPAGLTPAGFSFVNLDAPATIGDLRVDGISGASASGFTRLGLIGWNAGGRLSFSFNYLESHFNRPTVAAMAGGLEDVFVRWTSPRGTVQTERRLEGEVLRACERFGDRLLMPGLGYTDLARGSAALAARLSGSRLAVLADPGPEGTLAIVAALRAGATYVPLDPDWPDARIASVLDEAKPAHLLTGTGSMERARRLAGAIPIIPVDVRACAAADQPASAGVDDGHPAYIMFTSGSTGRPKGAVVGHRAVLTLLDWVQRMLRAGADDCFLQSSALTFGASLRQTFAPILIGARAAPLPPHRKKDPAAVLDALAEHRVTILNCVPSVWSLLMDAAEKRGSTAALSALKWLLVGGEAVPLAYWHRWCRLVPAGPRVANLYGGAETIANVTWFEVPRDFDSDEAYLPIGWPRYGMKPTLEESGELVVSGPIADGYLNPADRGFVQDPRLGWCYHTGDLARLTHDGAWLFLGRRDHRVQIHGNRVELGEIEAALCGFDGVGAARVDYRQSRLTAVLEVRDGAFPDARAVRAFVASRLPSHMVPHDIQCTRQLERNSTGKILRLPHVEHERAPSPAAAASGPAASEPAAGLETALGQIWQRLLRLDRQPGPDDDFFHLGGDSLLAIEMILEAESLVGRRISPLVVHAHHRLSQLTRMLLEGGGASAAARPEGVTGVVSGVEGAERPLGPVQRGFWLASRQAGVQPVWTVRVPIRGSLSLATFAAAVEWVQDRHPILRTRFSGEPHRPTQRFGAGPRMSVTFDDVSALSDADRDRALARQHEEELAADIPLEGAPLLRLRLSRVGPDEHVLLASGHHIVSDAHSAWVLLAELFEQCRRLERGEAMTPPVPEVRYADVLATPAESPDPFWREYLGPHAETAGPGDTLEAAAGEVRYAKVAFNAAAFARLRRAAAAAGTSPFGLVFVAAAQSLHELIGEDSFVLATATAGREANPEGWANAVGPFAFGVPVVVSRGSDSGVLERLHQALAHAASVPSSLPPLLGAAGMTGLGRYFISWLETSASSRLNEGDGLAPRWDEIDLRFRTDATATAVSIAALAHDGLTLHVRGRADVERLARAIERRLRDTCATRSALIVYAPNGMSLPVATPTLVETVRAAGGVTDVVLLPLHAGELSDLARVRALLREAIDQTRAGVVALAGMLPSLTGLAAERLSQRDVVLTTGHAVTVVAMLKTVERILGATGRRWDQARVGIAGFGAIGQATLQLCVSRLGRPARVSIADPRFGTSVAALDRCDIILGASSAGHVLDVDRLAPGTLVVDDSFPRCFADELAWRRMEQWHDVLLVGGGMLDVGVLERSSPFPQAETVRALFPSRWLPGCHAEALLLSLRPELGATVGQVELRRARQILAAVDALGWQAAPLHLGVREIPEDWTASLRRGRIRSDAGGDV